MKILILSKKFPYPLREGEPIATFNLSRSLHRLGWEVSLLVMNTTKHRFDADKIPPACHFFKNIYPVEVDNRITAWGALKSIFQGKSYILSRFDSGAYGLKLSEILQSEAFDVVQLETVYMAHYTTLIRQISNAAIAMRAHNVEHEIWQRYAADTANPLRKWYIQLQNKSLRIFEVEKLKEYDLLIAITGRDLQVFRDLGFDKQGLVAPAGIDLSEYQPGYNCFQKKLSLAFIGALDWMPNQAGILWFIEKAWPELRRQFPWLEFHVAGKNTPSWLLKKEVEGVIFHGEIEDAKAFLNSHPVLLAPLFSGSGIKIKVLEGMALGRLVITTSIGAEGIPAIDGEHFLLAETPEDFVRKVSWCIGHPGEMFETGQNARRFAGDFFDNNKIAKRVGEIYQKILSLH